MAWTTTAAARRLVVALVLARAWGFEAGPRPRARLGALRRGPAPLGVAKAEVEEAPAYARLAVLCSVPVVWGTYAPAVKAVYGLPAPPPGAVFSLLYYVVALACLSSLSRVRAGGPDDATSTSTRRGGAEEAALGESEEGTSADVARAGLELGGYLYVGNLFQVVGLETVSADAAAFLVQLTTVLVPVLESVASRRAVARETALACAVAFAGVAVLCAEGLSVDARAGKG